MGSRIPPPPTHTHKKKQQEEIVVLVLVVYDQCRSRGERGYSLVWPTLMCRWTGYGVLPPPPPPVLPWVVTCWK